MNRMSIKDYFRMIRSLEDYLASASDANVNREVIEEEIITEKRELRKRLRMLNRRPDAPICVRNEGDSAVFKVYAPEDVTTEDSAERFFAENFYEPPVHSMYDCTGRRFTTWYHVGRQKGRFVIYYDVCIDV